MVRGLRFRRGRRETLVRLCVQLKQEGEVLLAVAYMRVAR